MSDPKQILVERDGHVARVVINRPERRNALSRAAWQSLAAAFDNLAVDPGIRLVILAGAGDHAFCAGNDISEFAEKRSTPSSSRRTTEWWSMPTTSFGQSRSPLLRECGATPWAGVSSSCSYAISRSPAPVPASR